MQSWCKIVTALGAGYAVSMIAGGLVVGSFHHWRKSKLDKVPIEHKRANPHITGFIEALVFTPLVLARPGDAVVAMGGWLALKMAATWQKDFPTVAPDDVGKLKEILDWQSHSFQALVSGFLSMAFAGAGGALARFLLDLPLIDGWPAP